MSGVFVRLFLGCSHLLYLRNIVGAMFPYSIYVEHVHICAIMHCFIFFCFCLMYSESIVVIQFKLIFLILYQNMQMVR
jgi:hypothetical protein